MPVYPTGGHNIGCLGYWTNNLAVMNKRWELKMLAHPGNITPWVDTHGTWQYLPLNKHLLACYPAFRDGSCRSPAAVQRLGCGTSRLTINDPRVGRSDSNTGFSKETCKVGWILPDLAHLDVLTIHSTSNVSIKWRASLEYDWSFLSGHWTGDGTQSLDLDNELLAGTGWTKIGRWTVISWVH